MPFSQGLSFARPQGSCRGLVQQQARGKPSTPTPEFLSHVLWVLLLLHTSLASATRVPCQLLGPVLWPPSQGFRTELRRTLKLAPVMAVSERDSCWPAGPGLWASCYL